MAKKIQIDIEVNGKMTKATVDAKKLRGQLDGLDDAQKKTTKSGEKFQKGLKGVGEQSANASKNFSKFSMGMGGFVGVYASLAAQLFAVSAAFQFLKRAGDLEALKAGQIAYASATGIAMRSLAKDIQAATEQQVTFQDAAQAGAIGTAAGLSTDQLTRLGSAAADAAQILGRDVTDSFNRLVRGVTKAEPELLDELGIILRLKDATEDYARTLGKSAEDLTQFEKSQAVANDVLGQAEAKYSEILDITGRTPNEFAQLGIAFDEVTNKLKSFVSVIAGPMAQVLRDTPILAGAAFSLLIAGPLKAMGFSLVDIANTAKASADTQIAEVRRISVERKKLTNQIRSEEEKLRVLASTEVSKDTSSKILKNLAKGSKLYGADRANLKKALRAAELQLIHHGEITKGIFKGRDASVLASFEKTLDRMDIRVDENATRWQRWSLSVQASVARANSAIKGGVSKVLLGFTRLISFAGWAGIGLAVFKSLQEGLERFRKTYTSGSDPLEETFNEQAALLESAKEKIVDLAEEYEHFNKIQSVNMKYATTDLEIFHDTAQNIANMLATSFSGQALEGMRSQFSSVREEIVALAKTDSEVQQQMNSGYGQQNREAFSSVLQFFGAGKEAADGMAEAVSNYAIRLEKAVITGDDAFMTTSLSEQSEAVKTRITDSIESLEMFKKKVQETTPGAQTYKAFQDFSVALAAAQKLLATGSLEGTGFDSEDAIFAALEAAGPLAQALAGNLGSLKVQVQATNTSFADMKRTLKGLSSGDNLRLVAEAELKTLQEIIKSRIAEGKAVDSQTKRVAELNTIIELGTQLAQRDNDHKVYSLELQTEAVRNYAKISKAQGKSLKIQDKISKSEMESSFLIGDRNRLVELFADENGNVTAEVQRQLDLLNAQIDLEHAKSDLLQEQLDFQKSIRQQLEGIERLKTVQTIIGFEKEVLNIAVKTADLQRQAADARLKTAQDVAQLQFRAAMADNPFANKEREAAEFALQLAQQRYDEGINFINQEEILKINQINLEYKLLDAKRKQSILEAQILQKEMKQKKELYTPEDFNAINSAIQEMQNTDYSEQRNAAIALAQQLAESGRTELANGVLRAAQDVEAQDPFNKLFSSAVDSLRGSLNDAVNAIFDSLSDKTMNLSEKLKDIADSLLKAIQKSVTELLIVDPLMQTIGKMLGKEDPSTRMKNAIKEGHKDGATVLKEEIKSALDSTKVKLQCCEQKAQPTPPPAPTATSTASETPYAGPQSLEARTSSSINAAFTESERASAGAEARAYSSQQLAEGQAALGSSLASPSSFADSIQAPTLLPVAEARTMQEEEGGGLSEAMGSLRDSIGDLTIETTSNITAGAALVAGLTGNSKAAEALAKVTAALKAYQMIKAGIEKFLGLKRTTETGMLITALAANTASNYAAAASGAVPGFRYGGVAKPYSTGGIANGPNSGHLAMLHGKEAVVPLPNGNSIPVEMKNGGQSVNNVTVNVSTDGQTQSSSNGAMGENLGQVIAAAVQKELHNQKRAGGILNKHGAA